MKKQTITWQSICLNQTRLDSKARDLKADDTKQDKDILSLIPPTPNTDIAVVLTEVMSSWFPAVGSDKANLKRGITRLSRSIWKTDCLHWESKSNEAIIIDVVEKSEIDKFMAGLKVISPAFSSVELQSFEQTIRTHINNDKQARQAGKVIALTAKIRHGETIAIKYLKDADMPLNASTLAVARFACKVGYKPEHRNLQANAA